MAGRTRAKSDSLSETEILDAGVYELLEAYRTKRCTPSRAVEVYIAHQKRANPALNYVVEDRYAPARSAAAVADRLWKNGRAARYRLCGVPISMKDAFDVQGMRTVAGVDADRLASYAPAAARSLREPREIDAEIVHRLRRAGAIILNKSNTPTFCYCQETDSYGFGRANNPWRRDFTTGGSSGGEAGLVAVGGAAAGFGSDIGGSIRFPAHFCGVVGFKTAGGSLPGDGHMPPADTETQEELGVFGPITKSVRDAALLYSVAASETGGAAKPSGSRTARPKIWSPPEVAKAKLAKHLRLAAFADLPTTRCTPETLAVFQRTLNWFRASGVHAIRAEPPEAIESAAEIWQLYMTEDRGQGLATLAYPHLVRPAASPGVQGAVPATAAVLDWLKAKFGFGAIHHPFLSWGLIGTMLFAPSEKQLAWARAEVERGRRELRRMLGGPDGDGLLLCPVYPSPAKRHGEVYGEIFHIRKTFRRVLPYMALATVYGLPSLSLPLGRSDDGLPIGLQLAALPGKERLLLETAMVVERELGGYERCDFYDE
ncbi:MAG: amidase [Leptospirales bacterium]|jgi:fatty acid amide hydrolase 2